MSWKKYESKNFESIKTTLEILKEALEKKRDIEVKKAESIMKEIKKRGK